MGSTSLGLRAKKEKKNPEENKGIKKKKCQYSLGCVIFISKRHFQLA